MSYILEALKKSQQERELGQVPTLETPTVLAEEKGPRPNLWIPLAVVLAALAFVVASYSALRGGVAAPEPVAAVASSNETATPGQKPDQDVASLMKSPSQPLDPTRSAEQAPGSPSPRQPAGTSPGQGPAQPEIVSQVVVKEPLAMPEQSQSPAPEVPVAAKPVTTPERIQNSKVPPDLIADIEAFKQEVRKEQSGTENIAQNGSEIAPRDLRLPRDVRKRLPEFVLSAHIYDEDPSKRFVLINGLKTSEGEESREEITVEQILPEGVVLSFEGHRFFRRRR